MPRNLKLETPNLSLSDLDKQNIWHPFTQHYKSPVHVVIKKGNGVYIYDENGKKYLDAISSWWVNLFGHSNPIIANAISKQAQELEHVIFAGFSHEPAIRLSKNLLSILPENQSKIFFSDNGSTSVEVGLKMAIQYWYNTGEKRRKILALEGAYHGDTFGAMAVAERNAFSKPFDDMMFEVDFLPFPEAGKESRTLEVLQQKLSEAHYAAFIYEPLVQGTAGMRTYSSTILNEMMSLVKAKGVICIADEVMAGFGRTGAYFASDHVEAKPDIVCMSKGITGGFMAMGVTSATDKIYGAFLSEDKLKTFFHGHSYTANPLACAAANASFELLTKPETKSAWKRIERSHRSFSDRIKHYDIVHNVHVFGTILSLELNSDSAGYFGNYRDRIYQLAVEKDILLRPLGNVIYILPPYIINEEQLKCIYETIEYIIQNLMSENK